MLNRKCSVKVYEFLICVIILNCFASSMIYNNILQFNQNDSVGKNINPKSADAPIIIINSPISYSLFGNVSPNYSISISGELLNYTWYEFVEAGEKSDIMALDGVSTKDVNETFAQELWDNLSNGTVTIRFFANNSLGEIGYSDIILKIDLIDPDLAIIYPIGGFFNSTPPDFIIEISEPHLNKTWYTLNTNTTKHFFQNNGTINTNAWIFEADGFVDITFYANDSVGNEESKSTQVSKDTVDPVVSITLPLTGVYDDAPGYDISITELNLDQYWYTLNGGSPIYILSTTGTIDTTEWDAQSDGSVEIIFYAEDDAGHIGSDSVTVTKDTVDPVVLITAPVVGVYDPAPEYDISITEVNLDQYWYTLNGGTPIYISSTTGTIDSTEWDARPEGSVVIIFYAEDDAGHIGSDTVTVTKDTVDPVVSITTPVVGVYDPAPGYDISITEVNLDQYWYTLNGGTPIYISSTTGTIDSTEWDTQPEGSVVIIFYAEDDAGHIGSDTVMVTKDTVDPVVSITLPLTGVYDPAPGYDISITEVNLDQYWYTLNGGSPIYILSTTGTIDTTEWDAQPDGSVEIIFYAEDDVGHIGSDTVMVTKDTVDPVITITTPVVNAYSGAPGYDISISEVNLDQYWYTLNGGSPIYILSTTGTIDTTEWDTQPDGSVEIIFYAEDHAGHIGFESVTVTKDISNPSILDLQVGDDIWRNNVGTTYNVDFSDSSPSSNLAYAQYKITSAQGQGGTVLKDWIDIFRNLGLNEYTIDWTIDFTACQEGINYVSVRVYDEAGNYAILEDVFYLKKDTINPIITDLQIGDDTWRDTPGTMYNVDFSDIIPSSNLSYAQYKITSEMGQAGTTLKDWTNIFTNLGAISYTNDWMIDFTACKEGFNYISVRVYDVAGNYQTVNDVFHVKKDTMNPIMVVNTPLNNTYWNIAPMLNLTIFELTFDFLSYSVLGYIPIINLLYNNTENQFNQDIWNALPQGKFIIIFTCYDDLGHNSELKLTLYKDTVAPVLVINDPANQTYWNSRPFLNVAAFDPNLDTIWYRVNNINISLSNSTLQQLELSIWDLLPEEGEFQIQIFTNDSFGYVNDNYVLTLYKDILSPRINLISPLNNTFWKILPSIQAIVNDLYFDSIWYQVGTQTRTLLNNTNQPLDSIIWDNLADETEFVIYFYANDTTGNLNDIFQLILNKDIISPRITINSPNNNDLFGVVAPDFYISISELYLNQTWYTLIGGSLNYTFTGWFGTINQAAWEEFGNGTITIRFYANDTLNNLAFNEVTIRKNTYAPIISIISPEENDLFGIQAPNFTINKSGVALDTTWYTLDNGITNYTFSGLNLEIDQAAWDDFGFADVIVRFYINNSLGMIGYDIITIRKDPNPPVISATFISPTNNNSYCANEPRFRISAYDPNLEAIWYRVGSTSVFITNNTEVTLLTSIWDNLPQGIFIIEIYANDTLGYINNALILTFKKDTLAPSLIINQPLDYYYNSPPTINITVFDPNFVSLAYNVIGYSLVFLDNNTAKVLNQAVWDNLPQGEFLISISAIDIFGHVNDSITLTLYKDTMAPIFESVFPESMSFHNIAPILKVMCLDPNLHTIWYRFGTANIEMLNNIEQALESSIWDDLDDGEFTIEFFANDSFGHISDSASLTLIKDTTIPLITINSPQNNTYYSIPPNINIFAFDTNLDKIWYSVLGVNKFLSGGTEPLDDSIWNNLGQGEFQVHIFANDSAGNINSSLMLTLFKDTIAPFVIINLPGNKTFWSNSPSLNISAIDPNFQSISYKVSGWTIPLVNNTNTPIHPNIWGVLPEGPFIVEIIAVDTLGNINDSVKLTLYKDTTPPSININLPQFNDIFGDNTPNFDIIVIEDNLNTTWYSLIGESSKIFFIQSPNTIDQTLWDKFGNGTVTIRFYANDSAGNQANKDITVRKNIFPPIITVISPGNNELFGVDSPDFIISKSGPEIQATWYTLDNGLTNFTFSELNGTINQAIWSNFGYGLIAIRFYINDSFGKIGFDEVIIRKDSVMPIIIINSPINLTAFATTPFINLTLIDPNLKNVWYSLNNNIVDITNNLTIYFDFELWNNLSQGPFMIKLFANDTMGNLNNIYYLNLSKDTIGPNITIIQPIDNQKVGRNAPFFELSLFDENNIDYCWYTLDGNLSIRPFSGSIGRINQNLWEQIWTNLTNGARITIRFYANDTLGNVMYKEVSVIKEIHLDLPRFLSDPVGFLVPTIGAVVMIPFTFRLTKTRYYKTLNGKEKKKLRNVLTSAFFFLSLIIIFYIL